jgi:hypothetical protein
MNISFLRLAFHFTITTDLFAFTRLVAHCMSSLDILHDGVVALLSPKSLLQ